MKLRSENIDEFWLVPHLVHPERETTMSNLTVDQELKSLMPALEKEERELLEESIQKEGCRDPIIAWEGQNIIIDGINRYEICKKHDIPFKTISKSFESRDEAKIWIIKNQLGRRNLLPAVRAKLALELKPLIAEKAKEKEHERKTTLQNSAKSPPAINTRKEIAKIAHVSHDTVRKIEVIENKAPPEIKEKVQKGEMSVHKGYQTAVKKKKPKEKKDVFVPGDSEILYKLKSLWTKATVKDKKRFIRWLKKEEGYDS